MDGNTVAKESIRAEPVAEREVEHSVSELDRAAHDMRDLLVNLKDRIQPVMNQEEEGEQDVLSEATRGYSTPLAVSLQDTAQRIQVGNEILREILNRLEL